MNKIKFLMIAMLLCACAPSPETIQTAIAQTQAAWTSIPTQTPYPTYTLVPTYTVIPTITPTFTPAYTPTASNTPLPTADPLKAKHGSGFFLINVKIAPGVWLSNGTGDGCYWAVTTATGDILSNHFGQAGGTAYIPAQGFQVEFNDCGTWEYIGPP